MGIQSREPVTTSFDDINLVSALDESDLPCLSEIREVLLRHNRLDRFGMCLLHSHFPIADDEILLEETDVAARTLTLRPVKRTNIVASEVIETNWTLGSGAAVQLCSKKAHITPAVNTETASPAGPRAIQACTKKTH